MIFVCSCGASCSGATTDAEVSRRDKDGIREPTVSDLSNISINGEQQTWKQLYEREHAARLELDGYQIMLSDLDRNEHGRHQGDRDSFDPAGISPGNPHLKTGDVIGYSLHGTWKYVVPEPRLRGDLSAWRQAALREVPDAVTDKKGNPT